MITAGVDREIHQEIEDRGRKLERERELWLECLASCGMYVRVHTRDNERVDMRGAYFFSTLNISIVEKTRVMDDVRKRAKYVNARDETELKMTTTTQRRLFTACE